MMAYLAMMAIRLLELHRVLRPTGSLYLHCDPTASHYLKVLMDAVFGVDRFLNEIVWQRTGAHNDAKRFGRVTDSILLFSKTSNYTFNPQYAGIARSMSRSVIGTPIRTVDCFGPTPGRAPLRDRT